MENPEASYHTIDAATMYKYDNHTNIPWAISEYHTPRLQMNVDLQLKKRKWESQKKGEKDTKYVTRRGFYMDYDLKVAKQVPSTHAHGAQNQWNFDKLKKIATRVKVDPKLSKYTYLDRIEMEQKNRKSPGICTYSLEKSLKELDEDKEKMKKQKVSVGEKIYFYQNTQRLSQMVPGAGNYSPHDVVVKNRLNKTDYKFWIKKHKDQTDSFLKKQLVKPAPGTHSPLNTTLETFDQLADEYKKPNKRHLFGTDSKFEYTRDSKKKIVEKRPAPSSYATTYEWRGKDTSPKKELWNQKVWRGHSSSVYH